jgi:hypothetical protein
MFKWVFSIGYEVNWLTYQSMDKKEFGTIYTDSKGTQLQLDIEQALSNYKTCNGLNSWGQWEVTKVVRVLGFGVYFKDVLKDGKWF